MADGVAAGGPSAVQALWAARGVAIVGVSDRSGSLGQLPVRFLERYGYGGPVATGPEPPVEVAVEVPVVERSEVAVDEVGRGRARRQQAALKALGIFENLGRNTSDDHRIPGNPDGNA